MVLACAMLPQEELERTAMFVGSWKTVCILLFLAFVISHPASAQTGQATDNVYWPGYVTASVPLSLFLPQSLRPACNLLTKGDLTSAENAFAAEIRLHPDDLAAYVGYLQATHGHRADLLQNYEQEAKRSKSPVSAFKLVGRLAHS